MTSGASQFASQNDAATRTGPPFSPALLTDLYELTMLQAYFDEQMHETAVFSLFVRRLPERRNYLLACGLDDVLAFLETLRFDDAAPNAARLPSHPRNEAQA